jgi:hypothetical protein
MSEQVQQIDPLKQALADILTTTTSGLQKGIALTEQAVEKGSAFLMNQLPEVIQQLLWWKMWESIVSNALIIVLFFLLPFIIIKKTWKKGMESFKRDATDEHGIALIIAFIWILIGTLPLGMGTDLTWLQIWIAPKIYLIEYAAELLK